MIVIFIDSIEDFLKFLERRISNEIFYELKENKINTEISSPHTLEIILHFLAKLGDNTVLYETKQTLSNIEVNQKDENIIIKLEEIFKQVDPSISLIKEKIREIFLSYSP